MLVLDWNCRFFPINKEILGFLNVTLAALLGFSQFMKKIKKIGFLNISVGYTFQITKEFKNWAFGSPTDFIFCWQAQYVCRREGDPFFDQIGSFHEKEMFIFK